MVLTLVFAAVIAFSFGLCSYISHASVTLNGSGVTASSTSGNFLDLTSGSSSLFSVNNTGNVGANEFYGSTISTTPAPNLSFTSTGGLSLNAGGSNQNITLNPSGTGSVIMPADAPSSAYTFSVNNGTVIATPNNPTLPAYSGADAGVVINEAIQQLASVGGRFYFKNGVYNFDSLQSIDSSHYAAVLLPAQVSTEDWVFEGESATTWTGEINAGGPPMDGVIFNITATAITSAGTSTNYVYGIAQATASGWPFMQDEFYNLTVRFPSNQREHQVGFYMNDAGTVIFSGTLQDYDVSYISLTESAQGNDGYWTPHSGDGNVVRFDNTYAVGDWVGYYMPGEHNVGDSMTAIYCNYWGIVAGNHASIFRNIMDQENLQGLNISTAAGALVDITGYDIEQATSGTWARQKNLVDNNNANGFISYDLATQGVGPAPCPASAFATGGAHFVQECGGALKLPNISPNGAITTLAGTTAGNLYWSQPFQGSAYKKTILNFQGFENTSSTAQTVTFPTAFSYSPSVVGCALPSGVTVSTTGMSAASMSATFTGQCIIEGQ